MTDFKALMVEKKQDHTVNKQIRTLSLDDLPDGEVLVNVHYSSVNYKDGMAVLDNSPVVGEYPMVPGIDLSGVVEESNDARFTKGDYVIVTSYELGTSHFGGFAEYARVPADWVVPLPENLGLKEAMIYGTAGFTAALSVIRLEEEGVMPEKGTVLVTGATGGVGSMAVAMLDQLGYTVAASTGKQAEHDYLKRIGADQVLPREELQPEKIRPIDKRRWAGVVDPVGGETLAYALSTLEYGGTAAVSGLTGGTKVPTTVYPFIIRGANLVGIDSVYCPMERRKQVWDRLSKDLNVTDMLETIASEVTLDELPDTLEQILQAKVRGRKIVRL
ncbi:putative quinone oxidoreductase, YhdH/YhfP family [Alteribacillus persepolensis]|uniref:Putative quinone oxidoreductase, YhdH/YhfP family n=1 Tax=Alteribacillus persepolensis TaxID=568899 RepID=A0A1G8F779_9BACI|nr:acryloyl-CoA reductase [Alteribacillus persepolensis]SDH78004.1 putative quinone oxidoreductase, YhdH/YhfP family [Alteribacillus persepolensis]